MQSWHCVSCNKLLLTCKYIWKRDKGPHYINWDGNTSGSLMAAGRPPPRSYELMKQKHPANWPCQRGSNYWRCTGDNKEIVR